MTELPKLPPTDDGSLYARAYQAFTVQKIRDELEQGCAVGSVAARYLLDRLTAVEALVEEAERGEGIVITPGFTTYYSVDTGLLRLALEGGGLSCCGHSAERHGPEAGGCIECRCTNLGVGGRTA